MEKLIKIQNELKVPKGNLNKFGNYKYRSAEDILEALKPILAKNEAVLTLTDDIVLIGAKYYLKSTACLTVNEQMICVNGFAELSEHKGMSAEQCTGTASSYARKYALNGLFLIDETEQDADSNESNADISKLLESSKDLKELETNYLSLNESDKKKFATLTNTIKAKLIKPTK
jgi:hypothetical protein